jgi:hypothetical protein
LLAVQHVAARAIPTSTLSKTSLHGLRIVLNVDATTMAAQQRLALEEFQAGGGTLVDPTPGWRSPAAAGDEIISSNKQMDDIQKLWEATYNATVRKNFGARTFNTSTVLFDVLSSSDDGSRLVHLLNYSDFAADAITVQVLGTWKRARLYLAGEPVQELPVYPVQDGTGVDIAQLPIAGTLRFD